MSFDTDHFVPQLDRLDAYEQPDTEDRMRAGGPILDWALTNNSLTLAEHPISSPAPPQTWEAYATAFGGGLDAFPNRRSVAKQPKVRPESQPR